MNFNRYTAVIRKVGDNYPTYMPVTVEPLPNGVFVVDTSTYKTVTIGKKVKADGYDFSVDWGDGNSENYVGDGSASLSHTYANSGQYNITITGKFYAFNYGIFGQNNSQPVLVRIARCSLFSGNAEANQHQYAFSSCSLLESFPATLFGNITSLSGSDVFNGAFGLCSSLSSIPSGAFAGISDGSWANTFFATFIQCAGLVEIPENLFRNITTISGDQYFAGTFQNCSSLPSLPSNLFNQISSISGANVFDGTFSGCLTLSELPAAMFAGLTTVTGTEVFRNTFYSCSGLLSLAADLFSGLTTVTSQGLFRQTFWKSGITAIPAGLFANLSGEVGFATFYGTFAECRNLTVVPSGLFSTFTSALLGHSFRTTFAECSGIISVENNVFNPTMAVSGEYMFSEMFRNCTAIQSIPANLFSWVALNDSVSTAIFFATFSGCSSLASIPATLFAGANTVFTAAFQRTFENCSSLVNIPIQLFSSLRSLTGNSTFLGCFKGCTSLVLIPSKLFNSITLLTIVNDFVECFMGCTSPSLVIQDPLPDFVKYSNNFNVTRMFFGCSGVSGALPAFWVTYPSYAGWTRTDCMSGCYLATNYGAAVTAGFAAAASVFTVNTGSFKTITIGTKSTGTTQSYNCAIDWDDGSPLEIYVGTGDTKPQHVYTDSATSHDIRIYGQFYAFENGIYGLTTAQKALTQVKFCVLFSGRASNGQYESSFSGCSALTSVSANLFSEVTGALASTFQECFRGCTSLTTVPSTLFSKMTSAGYWDFQLCFYQSGIVTIPSGLFGNVTSTSTGSFQDCFRDCLSLVTVPATLFSKITLADDNAFRGCFMGCPSIATIPSTLFSNIVTAYKYSFSDCFRNCTLLAACPSGLFAKVATYMSVTVGTFNGCFQGCTKSGFAINNPFGSSPPSNLSVVSMFQDCSGTSGNVPAFWSLYNTANWAKTNCFTGCVNAGNYATAVAQGFA